jgi:hypothetical protein
MLSRLLAGAATETRNAAKEAVRAVSLYYGEHFPAMVQRGLCARAASDLMRVA